MVAIRWSFLGLCLIFICICPTASTITLSKFQPVTGFSEECTNTYNTPLSACTALDFTNGKPCSQSCIKFLDNLTATIQKACQGSKAYPDTLMGMFFTFQGTKAICPNAQGPAGIDGQTSATVTSNIKPSPISDPVQDRPTDSSETTVPSPTVAATSVTTIPLSVLTAAPTNSAGLPESTKQPEKLQPTDGDGGGTPFDITSSSHHNLRPISWRASMMLGFAVLTCLI